MRKAINELASLVGFIVNNFNGNYVVITADHGFLFTETPPDRNAQEQAGRQASRNSHRQEAIPAGPQPARRRRSLARPDEITAKAEGDMEFWIPKAANRFHFTGSARFIHGGAMLQEIVVPVVTVRHVKGKGKQETADQACRRCMCSA